MTDNALRRWNLPMTDVLPDNFKRITVAGIEAASNANHGPPAQLLWIETDLLVVDMNYQRDASTAKSRRRIVAIAEKFDWRKFAPVVVSPIVGGFYAIVDGQHRTAGAMLCGITKVPCAVILADAVDQARAFNAINREISPVTPLQLFKAKITGGDPDAIRVKRVIDNAGVVMMTSNNSGPDVKVNETMALNAIQRAIAAAGEDTALLALTLLRRSATQADRTLVAANITALVEAFLQRPDLRSSKDVESRSLKIPYGTLRAESMRLAAVDRTRRQTLHLRDLIIKAFDRAAAPAPGTGPDSAKNKPAPRKSVVASYAADRR